MRKFTILSAALILTVAGFFGTTGIARATLIYDITAEGPGSFGSFFSGSGTIEFNALSGTDTSGLDSFFFSGTGPRGDFSFDALDVRRLDWTIDGSGVLTLNTLDALISVGSTNAIFTCLAIGSGSGLCELPNFNHAFTVDFPAMGQSRGASRRQTLFPENGQPQFNVATTAVVQESTRQVPEPSALGILLVGLTGLALASARGRKQRSSNPNFA